jgi:hypothetical protein
MALNTLLFIGTARLYPAALDQARTGKRAGSTHHSEILYRCRVVFHRRGRGLARRACCFFALCDHPVIFQSRRPSRFELSRVAARPLAALCFYLPTEKRFQFLSDVERFCPSMQVSNIQSRTLNSCDAGGIT